MTRINCIDPAMLNNKHLGAAWNETPRIITEVESLIAKGVTYDDYAHKIPEQYVFGAGHNTFFYNKLEWVYQYLCEIMDEGKRRGLNYDGDIIRSCFWRTMAIKDLRWRGHWDPSHDDIMLNMARLVQNHFKTSMRVDGRSVIE